MKKKNIGSTLESFFEDLGETDDVRRLTQQKVTAQERAAQEQLLAKKKLLAARIERAMAKKKLNQTQLAKAMSTSRTVVHRLLDPTDTGVTFATLCSASAVLGVKLLEVG